MQPTLTNHTVTPIVHAHFADATSTVRTVDAQPLTGGTGEGLGIYRVSGKALVRNAVTDWSVVLKILSPVTSGPNITDWNYWRREAHVYESGLLTTLPGPLTTSRCYGVQNQADGTCWIWLEDLGQPVENDWTTGQYWQAAHGLGHLNGHYLIGHPLPDAPWLNRTFLSQWLDRAPGMSCLDEVISHPLVQRLYPVDVLVGYRRLWAMRDQLLAMVTRLPHTFCHLDAFSNNLLLQPTATGTDEFVAIDWAYAGIDAIGAELVPLIFARVTLLDRVDRAVARANADDAVDGYLAGLTAVGWRGDPATVRIGYLATALLRYGVGMVPVSINVVTDPHIHEWAEPFYGHPIEEMIDYWVEVARWRLDLMTELVGLLDEQ